MGSKVPVVKVEESVDGAYNVCAVKQITSMTLAAYVLHWTCGSLLGNYDIRTYLTVNDPVAPYWLSNDLHSRAAYPDGNCFRSTDNYYMPEKAGR